MNTSSVRPMSMFPPLSTDAARLRVATIGRSLAVALADDAYRVSLGHPPILSADDFARVAREAAHYAAPLLAAPSCWCLCGSPLASAQDLTAGACRWCRSDNAARAAIVVLDASFAAEVLS